jgi:hypothetical protein
MNQAAESLVEVLGRQGLHCLGWFRLEAADIAPGSMPVTAGMPGLLFGSARPMWDVFAASREHGDGLPDPLDRWTARIVNAATADHAPGALPLFPFGPVIWPFQRFARRAAGLGGSPLGILIHPHFGLWHALRAAVVFPGLDVAIAPVEKLIHPCDECVEKPCLSACPVNALSGGSFDVRACRGYLAGLADGGSSAATSSNDSSGPDCMTGGCAARNACPVGRQLRYHPDQIRFHMEALEK